MVYETVLSRLEARWIAYFASRVPSAVEPDHFTAVGLLAAMGVGACYVAAGERPESLLLAVGLLFVNWLGDSLDGAVARLRRDEKPRYGFYVDHLADSLASVFVLGGLAFSEVMEKGLAVGLLVVFLLLSIQVYLATYAVGRFEVSHWGLGPTEIRLFLVILSLLAYWTPRIHVLGGSYRPFDLLGGLGIVLGLGMLLWAALRTLKILRRIDG